MARMTSLLIAGALLLTGLTSPARAQEPEAPTALVELQVAAPDTVDATDLAERQQLAAQFVELSVIEPMRKSTSAMVEVMLSDGAALSAEQTEWWRRQLPEALIDISEGIAAVYAPLYADRMTRAELEALLAFYETPAGREILRKTTEIGFEVGGAAMLAAIEGLQGLQVKFCCEFDCAALEAAALGAAKP